MCMGRVTGNWERARAPGWSLKARTALRSPSLPACSLSLHREGLGHHAQSRGPRQGWVKRESLPQGAEAKVNRDKAVAQQPEEQRAGCCRHVRGRTGQ